MADPDEALIEAIAERALTKLRWGVAEVLGRSRRWCWADLVLWANWQDAPLIESRRVNTCRADAARCGTCYCSKFRTQQAQDSGNLTGNGVIVEVDHGSE